MDNCIKWHFLCNKIYIYLIHYESYADKSIILLDHALLKENMLMLLQLSHDHARPLTVTLVT